VGFVELTGELNAETKAVHAGDDATAVGFNELQEIVDFNGLRAIMVVLDAGPFAFR
jgi:hypothetical protein